MPLPIFLDPNRNFMQMQTVWSSQLSPMLASALTSSSILTDVPLAIGDNVINHKLGRIQQGWIISDINAVSSIYRSGPFNALTLKLNASAACTVSILVY